jgi:hypothetical protein
VTKVALIEDTTRSNDAKPTNKPSSMNKSICYILTLAAGALLMQRNAVYPLQCPERTGGKGVRS